MILFGQIEHDRASDREDGCASPRPMCRVEELAGAVPPCHGRPLGSVGSPDSSHSKTVDDSIVDTSSAARSCSYSSLPTLTKLHQLPWHTIRQLSLPWCCMGRTLLHMAASFLRSCDARCEDHAHCEALHVQGLAAIPPRASVVQ